MMKFSELVIKFRWYIIAIVLALSIFLGFQIRNIKINSDVISSLPNDKDAVLLKQIGEQFDQRHGYQANRRRDGDWQID